jgi:fructokinase
MRPKKKIFRFGVDLGGTKTEAIILDNENQEIFRKRVPTEQEKGYEHIVNNIHGLYLEMLDKIANENHTFGIGTPGAVSKKTGLIKNANIACMNGMPFVADLETKLGGRKIARQNDSNCFAMAEANFGAGKGKKIVFGAIMGTGVGGGLVLDGKLISGLQSIAGEWGHSIINSIGDRCEVCGKIGCIETFLSGHGVEKKYQQMHGEKIPMKEIVHRYRLGDDACKLIMSEYFSYFGKAFSNLIAILDPDVIVIGGGLSNIEELYVVGVNRVRDYIFNDELRTPIVRNKLGDSAGVLGAALIGV